MQERDSDQMAIIRCVYCCFCREYWYIDFAVNTDIILKYVARKPKNHIRFVFPIKIFGEVYVLSLLTGMSAGDIFLGP